MPPAVVLDAIIAAATPWRVGAKSSEEVGVGVVLRFGFCGPIVEGGQAHGGTRSSNGALEWERCSEGAGKSPRGLCPNSVKGNLMWGG